MIGLCNCATIITVHFYRYVAYIIELIDHIHDNTNDHKMKSLTHLNVKKITNTLFHIESHLSITTYNTFSIFDMHFYNY